MRAAVVHSQREPVEEVGDDQDQPAVSGRPERVSHKPEDLVEAGALLESVATAGPGRFGEGAVAEDVDGVGTGERAEVERGRGETEKRDYGVGVSVDRIASRRAALHEGQEAL
jgi:hypothetical protein